MALQRDRPGRTVHRPKNQVRVVVTFEVEIPESTLHSMPGWKRHALHYFRDLRDTCSSPQVMINTMRKRKGITILSETVEVAP